MSQLRLTLLATLLWACGGTTAAPAPKPGPAADPHAGMHHGEGFHHRFDDVAHWVTVFDDPARDAWQKPDQVIALMQLTPGMTVADLGAGTGYFLPHLSRAVGATGHVLALDIEPNLVAYMKQRAQKDGLGNVQPAVVAPDDPALPAGGVDRVLIVDTWHHISDREAYVQKLRAGLAPGGRVVIVDFTAASPQGPPAHARLPPEQVIQELTAGGLTAHLVTASLPDQYLVVGELPLR